jgi:hypothetical protein
MVNRVQPYPPTSNRKESEMAKSKGTQNGRKIKFTTTKVGDKKTSTGRHKVEVEMLIGYDYQALKMEDLAEVSKLYHAFILDPQHKELRDALDAEGVTNVTTIDIRDAFCGKVRGRYGLMTSLMGASGPQQARWNHPHPTKEGVVVHNTTGVEYYNGVILKETILEADPNGDKPKMSKTSSSPVVRVKRVIEKLLNLKTANIRTYKV